MITVGDRGEQSDVSPLELHFEQSFSNAYGINALYSQMGAEDWIRVKTQLQEDLKNYYSEMGGI